MEYLEKPYRRLCIDACILRTTFLITTYCYFSFSSSAQCINAGTREGTIFTTDNSTGQYDYSSKSNAAVSDNNRAEASALAGILTNDTYYLVVTGFGFSIPNNSLICGISVEIERRATGLILTAAVRDNEVKLTKGGVITGENKAKGTNWGSTDAVSTYGGSSDLWNTTLSVSEVNASNFGIAFSARLIALITALPSAQIDNVRITVYYQPILPIVLHYFKASRLENKSILEWETMEEEDRGTIFIERSNNSIQWDKIAAIATHESYVKKKYRYEDVMQNHLKYYYRLKITADNGYTYYSDIKTIDNRTTENFSVYPNPAGTIINLKNVGRGSNVTITNNNGQVTHPPLIRASGEDRQYNLQHLQKGIYYLYVNGIAFPFQKN